MDSDVYTLLVGILAFALCLWTLALVFYSLQLHRIRRELEREQRGWVQYQRLKKLSDKQNGQWN